MGCIIIGMDTLDFEVERELMISQQIERRGLHNPHLLQALRRVPRHCFVPPDEQRFAYEDRPLPIGSGQTISQPYIVALMTNLLALEGGEKVLEIGTGSGYQAAVLSCLAGQVYTIERFDSLANTARQILAELGITNVTVCTGDGTLGLPEYAPFEGILVTAGAPQVPPSLLEQLAVGGRMVIPVGGRGSQDLQVWERSTPDHTGHQSIIGVSFVPLRGTYGWKEEEWV